MSSLFVSLLLLLLSSAVGLLLLLLSLVSSDPRPKPQSLSQFPLACLGNSRPVALHPALHPSRTSSSADAVADPPPPQRILQRPAATLFRVDLEPQPPRAHCIIGLYSAQKVLVENKLCPGRAWYPLALILSLPRLALHFHILGAFRNTSSSDIAPELTAS